MSGSPEDREIGRLQAEVEYLRQRVRRAESILSNLREVAGWYGHEHSDEIRSALVTAERLADVAEVKYLHQRADRAERILATLEGWLPDDVDRQYDALYALCGDSDDSTIRCAVANLRNANRVIRAALVAAEQEVGRG